MRLLVGTIYKATQIFRSQGYKYVYFKNIVLIIDENPTI